MATELTAWTAIMVIAMVTFLNRVAGPIMMTYVTTSARIERFLDAMSVSVIVALVASILAQSGWREAVAVGFASLVMVRSNSAIWSMVAGICVAATWSLIAS